MLDIGVTQWGANRIDYPKTVNTNLGIHDPEIALKTSQTVNGESNC